MSMEFNLDAMNEYELRRHWLLFDTLAEYAKCKGIAMEHRSLGNIDSALKYERRCNTSYLQIVSLCKELNFEVPW